MNRIVRNGFKRVIKISVLWNTVVGIGLRGLGDVIQQTIERKSTECNQSNENKGYNWIRTSISQVI